MGWEQVYDLISSCGGQIELADPAKIAAATSDGQGDPATQIMIAQIEYARNERKREQRKEEEHGQERWHF